MFSIARQRCQEQAFMLKWAVDCIFLISDPSEVATIRVQKKRQITNNGCNVAECARGGVVVLSNRGFRVKYDMRQRHIVGAVAKTHLQWKSKTKAKNTYFHHCFK